MSAKYQPKRIHIKPADYIAKYEEYDEASPSYVAYYTEPVGEFESNEISDTVYHANDEVPYHEHERGIELFLVDAGRVEVWIRRMASATLMTAPSGESYFRRSR
jgi:hypothetical protein